MTAIYYASLKQQADTAEETIETEAETLNELFAELSAKHQFRLDSKSVRIACNDSFCDPQKSCSNGDRIAFLPPVAGG